MGQKADRKLLFWSSIAETFRRQLASCAAVAVLRDFRRSRLDLSVQGTSLVVFYMQHSATPTLTFTCTTHSALTRIVAGNKFAAEREKAGLS